jgi:hypothetical protein
MPSRVTACVRMRTRARAHAQAVTMMPSVTKMVEAWCDADALTPDGSAPPPVGWCVAHMQAFERLLDHHPDWRGKAVLVQVRHAFE